MVPTIQKSYFLIGDTFTELFIGKIKFKKISDCAEKCFRETIAKKIRDKDDGKRVELVLRIEEKS